jgi:protein-S-isoprenylcysteine O-methyltransferase Ste14
MKTTIMSTNSKKETAHGILRWAGQMSAALIFFGALLFIAAGNLAWIEGWVYLGMNALTQLLSALVLIPRHADMLADRTKVRQGTKDWDRFLAPAIVLVGTFAVLVIAGLDHRFGWSQPIHNGLWWLGLVMAFASQMFVLWAMASNPFFATTVRIQEDRGHTVVATGPYRLVRHPGYSGSLIYNLVIPLVLGSWWVFIPTIFTIALTFVRTRLEDRTLCAELAGYQEYSTQTRYRLIPGIW